MKRRPRIYYSDAQKALMWDRWKDPLLLLVVKSVELAGKIKAHNMPVSNLSVTSANPSDGTVTDFFWF